MMQNRMGEAGRFCYAGFWGGGGGEVGGQGEASPKIVGDQAIKYP